MLERNWRHQMALAMPCKIMKIVGMVHPTKLKQNLRVFWKLMNPQECVWEIRYRIIMKTILQENVKIHYSTTIWFTSLFLCLKLWKFLQQKQRWTRNGKNWRKFRRGTWQNSEVNQRWSMKQGRRAQKFILLHWRTSVIWRMPNWRQNTKNYKGRAVLRGDIVKDDSGSYAVSTGEGSSASQMTAAKVMDIISRLPGCDGQAADAVSAYTQVIMEDAPKLLKIPKSECPDIWIRLPRHKWPKSSSSMEDPVVFWAKFILSSFGRTVMGKAIWENPIELRFGEGFQFGMLIRTPWKKGNSYLCMWMTSSWLERNKALIRCGK